MGLVYHYSSPQGALGIMQNKSFWFTDCEFMNDPAELAYCYELYDRAWVEVCREFGVPETQIEREITRFANPYECRAEISDALGIDIPARYYALSTCSNGDDAAMWANYAIKGGRAGYALALDGESLTQALEQLASEAPGFGFYVEVIYGQVQYIEGKQLENIKSAIKVHLERLAEAADSSDELDRILCSEIARTDHWGWFGDVAPFIKRPEFAYEQEYRFVLKVTQLESEQKAIVAPNKNTVSEQTGPCGCSDCPVPTASPISPHFREGFAGAITPYFEVGLGDAFADVLRAIRGNSFHNAPFVKEGIARLVKGSGLKDVSVEMSDVLLRG